MNKLTELSIEELKKKGRTLELVTGLLAGLTIMMIIIDILDYFNAKTFNLEQLFPILLVLFLIINYIKIKKIKTEIQSRN